MPLFTIIVKVFNPYIGSKNKKAWKQIAIFQHIKI